MDVLIIGPASSPRVERLQTFLRGKGYQGHRWTPGGCWLDGEEPMLGAVCFDGPTGDVLGALKEPLEELRYLGVPLIVVTSEEKPDRQQRIRAAGADLLCDADTPDALILKELIAHSQAQPVAPETRAQLVAPLITAVRQTLSDMAGLEVVVRSVYQRPGPVALGDVSAVLTLSSSLDGALVLSCSTKTAELFAKGTLGKVAAETTPALVNDCIGELANVIAGQAKALLADSIPPFVFSTPAIVIGPTPRIRETLDSLVIAFASDQGGFALQLCRRSL